MPPPEAIEETAFVAEFEGALERLRDGIRAHNAARGIPDRLDSGYHETMTQGWLRLVHAMLLEQGPAPSAREFYEQHAELSRKKILRLFDSRERFMSREAKHAFLEPDLAPLPRPTGA